MCVSERGRPDEYVVCVASWGTPYPMRSGDRLRKVRTGLPWVWVSSPGSLGVKCTGWGAMRPTLGVEILTEQCRAVGKLLELRAGTGRLRGGIRGERLGGHVGWLTARAGRPGARYQGGDPPHEPATG